MLKKWELLALIVIATIVAGFLYVIRPANAKEVIVPLTMQCYPGDYAVMEENFGKAFNEAPLLQGIISNDDNKSLMYIFRNEDKWTFVYLNIEGFYCIPFYGDGLVLVHTKRKAHAQTY